jgi:hypothetical protein
MNKKILTAISVTSIVLVSSLLIWSLFRYEATALSLTFQTSPVVSSPLSGAEYSWEAKAYSTRNLGNSPFEGKGYVHRERITSENRFRYTEFHNLNVELRLRFQISNATGHMLCNVTLNATDGCDRQITFEFKPETAKSGNTLQLKITLNLTVRYNYGSADGEQRQFTLQKEWTKTIQVQPTEPETGTVFT